MKRRELWVLVAVMALAGALPALASGFSIYEQSAKASGQAGAWVARADDAAANWYNPAALTRLDGMEIQFGASLITIGSDTKLTSSDLRYGLTTARSFESVQNNATPVQLYCATKINDRLAFGFGLNNPFGLVTEWKDRPVTYSSKRVELVTFVANPNLAVKVNDQWSLAFGIDYLMADVKEFSREFDQSAFLGQPAGTIVGKSNLAGDGRALGWNLAAHFAAESLSVGFSYRAKLSPEIDGNVRFTGVNSNLSTFFPNGAGKTTLDLPAEAAVGVAFHVGDAWEMEGDVSWAQWSSFEKLAIDFSKNTAAVTDITQVENWKNTFAVRLGAAWKFTEAQELRFGAVWDQNPIPDDTLRPSIPDCDRRSVTLGYGYHGESWGFDAYYMPLFFQTRNAKASAATLGSGVIDGKYESFVQLLGASLTWRF
jgi:long-chain fatty acid transport protein